MVVKKAKTIPGKWGQEQKIKARKRELESIEDSKNIPYAPDFIIKPLAKRMLKKEIKQLESDSTYKEGKKWEKDFDKGWGKYEKGEHYAGGGAAKKGLGRAFLNAKKA
jgi:hypothetical protein